MNKKYPFLLLLVTCFFLLYSCNSSPDSSSNITSIPSSDIEKSVHEWNDAHHLDKIQKLDLLFDHLVLYYGKQMNKNQCIDAKRSHLLRFNDYEQKIIGAVSVQTISKDEVKCSFKNKFSKMEKLKIMMPI